MRVAWVWGCPGESQNACTASSTIPTNPSGSNPRSTITLNISRFQRLATNSVISPGYSLARDVHFHFTSTRCKHRLVETIRRERDHVNTLSFLTILVAFQVVSDVPSIGELSIHFKTSGPRVTPGFSPTVLYSWDDYPRKTEVRVALPDASPNALYASVRIGGEYAVGLIDGSPQRGYIMVLDLNGNGDLTDDPEFQLTREAQTLSATVRYGSPPTPLKLAVELDGDGAPTNRLRQHLWTKREGRIVIGDREILFALRGADGQYDRDHDSVFFDLNGDGKLDTMSRASDERFEVEERFVNIDGITYEFRVETDGEALSLSEELTLTPHQTFAPARNLLDPGNQAPDFVFRDLQGTERRLSDYRGQVVLLYFWGTWCGPCLKATPHLREAYEAFASRGFEIIGIDTQDSLETLQAYLSKHSIHWPQTMQGEYGPILDLYRVSSYPSSFLINENGTIVDRQLRASNLTAALRELRELTESQSLRQSQP